MNISNPNSAIPNAISKPVNQLIQYFVLFMLFSMTAMATAEEKVTDVEPFTQAELEQILAPIALYPDTVLSHILVAATYPLEVIQAERWTQKNEHLQGSDAVEAVDGKEWDPSVKALVAFPQVLKRLSDNLEWTQKLGDAFLQDEKKVIASVQSLRQRAYESGNLDKMDKVSVTHEDNAIVIEPIEREVVYVPYYDTRVVYGPWYWSHYPPVYWNRPHYISHRYRHHSPFYWGPRVHISFGFFFSSFHWHDYHLVRIPYHHYRHRPHHYYDRHQIVRHQHARRWAHNPTHRRGVSYRSVSVSNRYASQNTSRRASRDVVSAYRNNRGENTRANTRTYSTNERELNRRVEQATERSRTRSSGESNPRQSRNTRIATPNRIREELRDGRISLEERNSRPENSQSRTSRSTRRETSPSRSPRQTTRQPQVKVPDVKQPRVEQPRRESRERSQPRSSNRSSGRSRSNTESRSRSSSRPQSSSRSSGSKRESRSKGNRERR